MQRLRVGVPHPHTHRSVAQVDERYCVDEQVIKQLLSMIILLNLFQSDWQQRCLFYFYFFNDLYVSNLLYPVWGLNSKPQDEESCALLVEPARCPEMLVCVYFSFPPRRREKEGGRSKREGERILSRLHAYRAQCGA